MNKKLIEAARDSRVINGDGDVWFVISCHEVGEGELIFTLLNDALFTDTGVTIEIKKYTLEELLSAYLSVIFYPLDHEGAYAHHG